MNPAVAILDCIHVYYHSRLPTASPIDTCRDAEPLRPRRDGTWGRVRCKFVC